MTRLLQPQFDVVAPDRTRLTWIVDAEGFGASLLGRLFAGAYSRNLDRAVPALVTSIQEPKAGSDETC
ncbi:MAG: hypothetical protein ACT4PU_11595 [Planctomycetota bacterium]